MDKNSRAPLGDKTNTAKEVNAKERKRERDRARWLEQKDAINKRRREKYHQRKNQHVLRTTNYDDAASLILAKQMTGSIRMILIIPTILLMRTCPLDYHVI